MLIGAKQLAAEANTNIKQAAMQLDHLQSQLKAKQRESGSNAADYQRDKKHLETMEREVQSLEVILFLYF